MARPSASVRLMRSLTLASLAPGALLQLVLEVVGHAQEHDGARPGQRALATGRREGDVELVGEDADGHVVQACAATSCLRTSACLSERAS